MRGGTVALISSLRASMDRLRSWPTRLLFLISAAVVLSSGGAARAAVVISTPENEVVVDGESSWLTFGLDRIPFLRHQLLGNPLWQYLASFIFIVLAFYAAKLLDSFMQVQLRKWARKTA